MDEIDTHAENPPELVDVDVDADYWLTAVTLRPHPLHETENLPQRTRKRAMAIMARWFRFCVSWHIKP